jgi:hypothetical protein
MYGRPGFVLLRHRILLGQHPTGTAPEPILEQCPASGLLRDLYLWWAGHSAGSAKSRSKGDLAGEGLVRYDAAQPTMVSATGPEMLRTPSLVRHFQGSRVADAV